MKAVRRKRKRKRRKGTRRPEKRARKLRKTLRKKKKTKILKSARYAKNFYFLHRRLPQMDNQPQSQRNQRSRNSPVDISFTHVVLIRGLKRQRVALFVVGCCNAEYKDLPDRSLTWEWSDFVRIFWIRGGLMVFSLDLL